MRTIKYSLAWKEWHEHKWKLVSLTVVLCGVVSLLLLDHKRDMLFGAQAMLALCILPLTMFVGLGTSVGERSRGTLRFLQSLPVPMWRVALHKLGFGLVTVLVPIVLVIATIFIWCMCLDLLGIPNTRGERLVLDAATPINTGNWFINTLIMLFSLATSVFIWSAAAGVNRKDEVSAGAMALVAMVGWSVILLVSWDVLLLHSTAPETLRLRVIGVATAPGGFAGLSGVVGPELTYVVLLGLGSATIFHLLLAARYVRRFGRLDSLEVRSPQAAVIGARRAEWLAPPRRSPLTAIVWKQVRESGPIAAVGLAGILGIAALIVAGNWDEFLKWPDRFVAMFAGVSLSLGTAIAMVVGIGVCLDDARPKLNSFWRSRPINPDVWFWCKFIAGLGVTLVVLYVPVAIIAMLVHPRGLYGLLGNSSASDFQAIFFPLAHIAIFAAAVAMTCLVGRAVYAAILSMAWTYLGVMVGIGLWLVAAFFGWVEWHHSWWEPTDHQIVFGMIFSIVLSTLLAWLAVRYDWGQKSRS